jgi:hypothetical protein
LGQVGSAPPLWLPTTQVVHQRVELSKAKSFAEQAPAHRGPPDDEPAQHDQVESQAQVKYEMITTCSKQPGSLQAPAPPSGGITSSCGRQDETMSTHWYCASGWHKQLLEPE